MKKVIHKASLLCSSSVYVIFKAFSWTAFIVMYSITCYKLNRWSLLLSFSMSKETLKNIPLTQLREERVGKEMEYMSIMHTTVTLASSPGHETLVGQVCASGPMSTYGHWWPVHRPAQSCCWLILISHDPSHFISCTLFEGKKSVCCVL